MVRLVAPLGQVEQGQEAVPVARAAPAAFLQRILAGRAEAFQQFVFLLRVQRARARVALPAGAADQLVVETPGFVALRADHMQAARR